MNIATTILRCADPGMSDDQLDREHRLQQALAQAVAIMRGTISLINEGSSVEQINPDAFDDFVHDWLPVEANWDAKISEARRI